MASETILIRVYQVIGSSLCVASDDGQKVYEQIASVLKSEKKAQLSFQNVEVLTSAFLNTAVGQLYGKFSEEQIKAGLLPPMDIDKDDLVLLKRVVDRAKEYFKDPSRIEESRQEILGDDDE